MCAVGRDGPSCVEKRRCMMNKYVKEMVKVALGGAALAMALTGCCLWNSDAKDGKGRAGKPKASVLCNDRACSNATGGR